MVLPSATTLLKKVLQFCSDAAAMYFNLPTLLQNLLQSLLQSLLQYCFNVERMTKAVLTTI